MSTASKPSYRDSPGEETYHRSSIISGRRDLLKWCIDLRSHQGGLKTRATFNGSSWVALATGRVEVICPSIRDSRSDRERTTSPWQPQGNPGGLGLKQPIGNKKRSALFKKGLRRGLNRRSKGAKNTLNATPIHYHLLHHSQLQTDFLDRSLGHS